MRLSAPDWAEGPETDSDWKWLQWGIDQCILLTGALKNLGVDLIEGQLRANLGSTENSGQARVPGMETQIGDTITR